MVTTQKLFFWNLDQYGQIPLFLHIKTKLISDSSNWTFLKCPKWVLEPTSF